MMKFIFLVALLCSFNSMARNLEVAVTLSPAGDFKAKSTKVRGFIEKKGANYSATDLSVEVGTLGTDMELRDKHLHERLGGAKSKIVVKTASGADGKGKGEIIINKITKPFNFVFREAGGMVEAKFALKPSEFGIKDVKYLGVGVEDKVVVSVKIPVR